MREVSHMQVKSAFLVCKDMKICDPFEIAFQAFVFHA